MTAADAQLARSRATCCGRRSSTSLRKLDPRHMIRNPVMFVVEVGAVLHDDPVDRRRGRRSPAGSAFTVAVWLWLTVVFGNLAEAIAEGRGRAQADALRAMRTDDVARLADGTREARRRAARAATSWSSRPAR